MDRIYLAIIASAAARRGRTAHDPDRRPDAGHPYTIAAAGFQVSAARLIIAQLRMNSRPATCPAPKTTTRTSWGNWNRSSISSPVEREALAGLGTHFSGYVMLPLARRRPRSPYHRPRLTIRWLAKPKTWRHPTIILSLNYYPNNVGRGDLRGAR